MQDLKSFGIQSVGDVLGIMPTGAGKSMCFQIPALMMDGISLVVSPLISLMKDQVSALNQAGIHAAFLNSSLTAGQYRKALSLAEQGRYKIIYIAPERLEADITEEAASIFACIDANRVAYGITVIIDILRGSKNQRIHSRGLDKNPEYGRLAHVTVSRLHQIIQELLLREYLEQEGEEYPVLVVLNQPEELQTGEGRLVMKLAKERAPRQDSGKETKSRRKRTAAAVLSEQDELLFERLRSLRSEIAAEERVPPYIVFSDRSLVQMSAGRPATSEELLEIYGVGEFKTKKYGQRFLDVIREMQKSLN